MSDYRVKCLCGCCEGLIFKKEDDYRAWSEMAEKPFILSVETSGRRGSVALGLGEKILAETSFSAPMRHSAEIFGAVSGLLERFGREAGEIEQVYLSVGPGSFTGLRIAVTMAKMMHLANAVKIVAVDTLDVIAANISSCEPRLGRVGAVLDAKRGQFYIAVYECKKEGAGYEKVVFDQLMGVEEFLREFGGQSEPIWLLGEGLVYYKDEFEADGVEILDEQYWWPRAEKVHLLGWQRALAGEFADALALEPAYLRQPIEGKNSKS